MNQMKRKITFAVHIIISLAALIGVLLQCGVFSGKWNFSVLTYFTMMSNIGCMIYYGISAPRCLKEGTVWKPAVKGVLLLCISVTGLVYHMMLAGKFEMQGTLFISNMLLHYVVPISCFLQWLILDPKGILKWKMPFAWLLAPGAYGVFVHVAVGLGATLGPYGSKYPYYFMDPEQLGLGMTVIVMACMAVGFLLLGLFFVFVDHLLAKKKVSA